MRLQILSDLHFETRKDGGATFVDSLDPEGVDVLVLAGDITNWRDAEAARDQLARLTERYPATVYVPGNHEHWRHRMASPHRVDELIEEHLPDGVHLLQPGRTVTIGGQRFLGGTGWFPALQAQDRFLMERWPDFGLIYGLEDCYWQLNSGLEGWLMRELSRDDVVVTHHLPSTLCTSERWRGSRTNCFFQAGYDRVITEKQPKLWVFGHTHDPCDRRLGETRLVCNPLGYEGERREPGFRPDLVVEV